MGKVAVVVVFDFDRTLIDGDSDNWVVTEMGLTQLFHELHRTMPWTSLMVPSPSKLVFSQIISQYSPQTENKTKQLMLCLLCRTE